MRVLLILAFALGTPIAFDAPRAEAADPANDHFEKKIRPVLVKHCYECHSGTSRILQANLRLDTRDGVRKGGDSGPAVVPGKVDESRLIGALKYDGLEMPPKGKLPDAVIADFVKWVELGAADPRTGAGEGSVKTQPRWTSLEEGRKYWAFQPPKPQPAPKVKDAGWARTDLDRFVLAKLEASGLRPAAAADPETLIRRVYFDLIGLPPTPAQIDAYVKDESPGNFARLVDELLASPHFGERWGRHWLDVARFAESSGGGRSLVFPDAWRYRDYVIRAFNDDKPYDRFLTEQIAGDLLPADSPGQRHEQLVASGFLALGPTNYEEQYKDVLEMDVIDEQLDTLGRVVLGLTIGCARCHDHKFDPIPTRDYYALAGIMKSTQTLIHDNVSRWVDQPLPMDAGLASAVARHESVVAELKERIDAAKVAAKKGSSGAPEADRMAKGALKPRDLPGLVLDDAVAKRVGPWRGSTFSGNYIGDGYLYDDRGQGGEKTLTFVPEFPADGAYEVRLAYVAHENRAERVPVTILHLDGEKTVTVNQRETPPIDGRFVSLGTYRFDRNGQWFVLVSNTGTTGHISVDAVQFLSEKEADNQAAIAELPANANRGASDVKSLEAELKKLNEAAPKRPVTMSVKEAATVGDAFVCVRGVLTNRGPDVPRGFLRATFPAELENNLPTELQIPKDQSGRVQLARWLSSRENPLTARVMVNRIWHHLFGAGIVRTTDVFGTTGELPSHPEMLDHLALEFMRGGDGLQGDGSRPAPWSTKRLIRTIVLSRAYRMASDSPSPAAPLKVSVRTPQAVDPENRLLWRQNRRRLEAECLRDAMLAVSGRLDRTLGGPVMKPGGDEYGYQFTDLRRSVYTPILRNRLNELFEVFDFADPNLVTGRRTTSTVPTQALYLLNSPFVMTEALQAAKVATAASLADDACVEAAYRSVLGRRPTSEEMRISLEFVKRAENESARLAVWSRMYQSLFASIDFRYVR